jgi:hypothetical protein
MLTSPWITCLLWFNPWTKVLCSLYESLTLIDVQMNVSSLLTLDAFYNIELYPNPNVQSDQRLRLVLTSFEING